MGIDYKLIEDRWLNDNKRKDKEIVSIKKLTIDDLVIERVK